jgi:N-acyl-D-aspartate/D-glutamate deacylase
MGNCGVGIAPCKPAAREIAMRDLVSVEGIPFDVLNKGITWDWETFPQFMDAAAARRPSLNLAFIAPLTPFRHYVMGEASMERAASTEETAKIAALIAEAVDSGALGFSSTTLNQHMGFEGKPLACRNASREELKAYANVLKARGKGAIEIALTRQVGVLEEDQCELLDFLLDESGRPVTFIALFDRDDIPEAVRNTLRLAAPMIAKGARPQTSPLPLTREINMDNPFSFASFPSWKRVFADTSKAAQKTVYADPGFRNQFRDDLRNPTGFSNWGRVVVHTVKNPALKHLEDKSVAQIGQEQGKDGVDAFLDTVLADNLDCELTMASWNTREDRMRELLNNKAILMALGDGGAHVDMLCDAGYPTYLLGTWVREKEAITLEEGVRKLTSDPADLFGLKDRGRLAKGAPADVAIFDPARIGSTNHGERRYDLPGGAKRIVMPSKGVEYTLVNGAITWEQGKLTDARAGKVLRG